MLFSKFGKNNKSLYSQVAKQFSSNHSKFIIVGGGTAGISSARQLISEKIANKDDITIFDPAQFHYYQPGFTKIAGGVIKSNWVKNNFVKFDMKDVTNFVNFNNHGIKQFLPEEDAVITTSGDKFTYNRLIIAAGLQVNFDGIPGLNDLLNDQNSKVCSIYSHENSIKTKRLIDEFKGGKALFTQHSAPIKCAGAPQKILYLAHDQWDTSLKSKSCDIQFYTPLPAIFGIAYYAPHLRNLAERKGIKVNYTTLLTDINSNQATFKNTVTGNITTTGYDFIHVSPPMSAPSFLKGQPISDASGFVDITPEMRHKKYPKIYAAGDCISLPCAKTASAVFSQVPILIQNLKKDIEQVQKPDGSYQGYSACPIYLKKGSLMMAEFKTYNDEKGTVISQPDESFFKGEQTVPRKDFYYLTKIMTFAYYISLKRPWYGCKIFFKPNYVGTVNTNDYSKYYKYALKSLPFATVITLWFVFAK